MTVKQPNGENINTEILDVLLDNTSMVAFSRDLEGDFQFLKGNTEKIFGKTQEEILSKKVKWIELVCEEDRKKVLQSQFDAMKTESSSCNIEFRVRMPDGSLKWRRRVAVLTKNGDTWILKGIVRDIDDEKQNAILSKEMQSRFYDSANQIEEGLIILSKNYKTLFINDYARKLLSKTDTEFDNIDLDDVFCLYNNKGLSGLLRNTVSKGFKVKIGLLSKEAAFAKSESGMIPVEMKISRGQDEKIYISFNDISEIIEYEQKLLENTSSLESINKNLYSIVESEIEIRLKHEKMLEYQRKIADMGRLISSIAHRWRQPLNSVSLNIQYMKQLYDADAHDEKEFSSAHDFCLSALDEMSGTIDKFASFFVADQNVTKLNIVEKIDEITEMYISALESANIIFTQNVRYLNKDHLSMAEVMKDAEISGAFEIPCHENQLFNLIVNLLSNSRDSIVDKAEYYSNFQGSISLLISRDTDKIIIEINDNGEGISMESEEHIFEPYYTTKDEGKGIGMGLYLSKLYVENTLKGEISFKNLPNGCRFTVCLPVGAGGCKED